MRVYMKRLALIIVGALATTLLVSVLNSLSGPTLDANNEAPFAGSVSSKENAAIVVGLKPLQKKQSPESPALISDKERRQPRISRGPDLDAALETDQGKVILPKSDKLLDIDKRRNPDKKPLETGRVDEGAKLEEQWAKDDQAVVPNEPIVAPVGKKKRVLDKEIVQLKEQLHLNEFRTVDECANKTTLADYFWNRYRKAWPKDDSWESFYAQMGSCDMYREDSQILQTLLDELATLPIKSVVNMDGGTQIKLIFTFENGKRAVFKPMRFSRLYETDPNHFYFSDFERHHAEIAAFHLDKVLGFRRAVPTVGRVVNISSDLWAKADKSLAKTFFYSPAKNLCFVGKCDYYCDTTHAICGSPDLKEGSAQMFLPDDEIVPREHNKSPYRRTYSKRNQDADWQKDASYCNWKVKYASPFSNGRRLLDFVDLYILDFLMGNQDRHHYETIQVFQGHEPPFVHLDNGRAFGKPRFDDMSILAPFTQCCVIKPSTARTLLTYYLGPVTLSEALRKSLSRDPVAPILAEKYLAAVDRRLEIVLRELVKCLQKANGDYRKVLMTTFVNPDAPVENEEEEEEDE